jgi:hypothetical protein
MVVKWQQELQIVHLLYVNVSSNQVSTSDNTVATVTMYKLLPAAVLAQ